jgi:hypothetical protein
VLAARVNGVWTTRADLPCIVLRVNAAEQSPEAQSSIVIDVPEIPETLHSQRERGRLQAQGRRTDDNTHHTLLIINEIDGSWVIHGLGAPGARFSKAEMIALAEKILGRAR